MKHGLANMCDTPAESKYPRKDSSLASR